MAGGYPPNWRPLCRRARGAAPQSARRRTRRDHEEVVRLLGAREGGSMNGWTRFDDSHAVGERSRRLATEPLEPSKKSESLRAEIIAKHLVRERKRART